MSLQPLNVSDRVTVVHNHNSGDDSLHDYDNDDDDDDDKQWLWFPGLRTIKMIGFKHD